MRRRNRRSPRLKSAARREIFLELLRARDMLLAHRENYDTAYARFRWPRFERFNFAIDWFDVVARERDREALRIVDENGVAASFGYSDLAVASKRMANFLRAAGLRRGDTVLVMLGTHVALWEVLLACIRLGAVAIPATTLLDAGDLGDRLVRGGVRLVITHSSLTPRFEAMRGTWIGVAVGPRVAGWVSYEDARHASEDFASRHQNCAKDPLLLYFTSGTTAAPKLVVHDHVSYPIGHLSTLYWLGLKPGDRHLNISSPGWAKHAWSSVFAPWLAEATVVALNHGRFDACKTLDAISQQRVTTFCAPPTVWRRLIQQDLAHWSNELREVVSAGEPLNAEVIARVRNAWGVTIRDGYGQTETSAQIGNTPGMKVKAGSVGKPLPGFRIALRPSLAEGEICIELDMKRPVGLMRGYKKRGRISPLRGALYRTNDIATCDADGYLTFVGRTDDVFKSSDYRISPFELESVLLEHPAIAEAAVVPSPDPVRLAVPKAFVSLAPGYVGGAELASSIFGHCRARMSTYKRIRRLEFSELPKTISGKIRRVDLRLLEADRRMREERGKHEWYESELFGSDKPEEQRRSGS